MNEKKVTVQELEDGEIFDKVFDDIEKNKVTYIVYKDDKPYVVIMPYEENKAYLF